MCFRYLPRSIKFVSYSYRIFIANISICKRGLVVTWGFVCLLLISAKTRAYFCYDNSIIRRYSFKRKTSHYSECYLSTSWLRIYYLAVLSSYLSKCWAIVFTPIFRIKYLSMLAGSRVKSLLDIPHFCLTSRVSRICYFRFCLFENSCLHRWLEHCRWESVE